MYIKDKDGNYVPTPSSKGADGREVSLRVANNYIQWRYPDTEWTNLVPLSDLKGEPGTDGVDGREVHMRVVSDTLQWRLGDSGTWQTLMSLSTVTDGAAFGGMVVDKTLVLAEMEAGGGGGGTADAVTYTPQSLTDEQKLQARTNIGAYTKPASGIPKADLAESVQTSLAKADTAISLGLTAATPGQIIKVKTVQDGKPTEWEAVDMPSGDKWEKLYNGTIQIEQETMLVEVDIPRSDSAKEFHVYLHFAKNVAQEWDSAKLVQVHVNGAQLGYFIIYDKLTSDFYCFAKQSFDTVRRVEVMKAIGINPETNLSNIATQLLNWSVYEQTNTGKIRISFAAAYAGSIELLVYGRY